MRSQILFPRHCFSHVMSSSASSEPLQRLLWPATATIQPPNSSHDLSNKCGHPHLQAKNVGGIDASTPSGNNITQKHCARYTNK
uniref:Uncharacterized protein n=1 Tax=Rhipicephalus appendiculatus TaxID=34631 RepID=A0A131YAF3_RHIAP